MDQGNVLGSIDSSIKGRLAAGSYYKSLLNIPKFLQHRRWDTKHDQLPHDINPLVPRVQKIKSRNFL